MTTRTAHEAPSAPFRPIAADGGLAERNKLIQAYQERRLTDAERLRLAALTWTPDVTMERVAMIAAEFPDVAGVVPSDLMAVLPRYLADRTAAKAAGRSVAEPPEALREELAAAAAELRATANLPLPSIEGRRLDRLGREAFRAAVNAGDFGATVMAWREWLASIAAHDALLNRHGAARAAFGPSAGGFTSRPRPAFLRELEAAMGGSTSIPSGVQPGEMVAPR